MKKRRFGNTDYGLVVLYNMQKLQNGISISAQRVSILAQRLWVQTILGSSVFFESYRKYVCLFVCRVLLVLAMLYMIKSMYFVHYFLSVKITPDGMKAVVTLANGDMRKTLNILQVHVVKKVSFVFSWRCFLHGRYLLCNQEGYPYFKYLFCYYFGSF